jgi:phenylpropionate dioxygenase-like ring-hydroxylating dioxygenase large terminal subunit
VSKIDYHHLIQKDKIHGSLYTGEAIYEDEIEKIFYSSWVFIGHESEIKNRGDYVTRDIGRSSVIMVRGKDQEIQVIVNRCQHRGNLLCNESQGNRSGVWLVRSIYLNRVAGHFYIST